MNHHVARIAIVAFAALAAWVPEASAETWAFTTSAAVVRGAPGAQYDVVAELGEGRALVEISRLEPGRHLIDKSELSARFEDAQPDEATVEKGGWLGDEDEEEVVESLWFEIPAEDGPWVRVAVLDEGQDGWGKRGWVRASDIGPSLSAAEFRDAKNKRALGRAAWIEPGATIGDSITLDVAKALRDFIVGWGYVCDTVSSIVPFFFSEGFTVRCNQRRYSYEVENQGGRWIVKVI